MVVRGRASITAVKTSQSSRNSVVARVVSWSKPVSQSNVGFKSNPTVQAQHINVTFLVRKDFRLGFGC